MNQLELDNPLQRANWIWSGQAGEGVNQYVQIRHVFELGRSADTAELYLSADSNYAVWVNGCFVRHGQYHDYPGNKAYDRVSIEEGMLRAGQNVLCILVHHQGVSSFQYRKGNPGLNYALKTPELAIVSGSDAYCRLSPSYQQGDTPRITVQLGFTFAYDAEQEDHWLSPEYSQAGEWLPADIRQVKSPEVSLYERPIHVPELGERADIRIVAQGVFLRVPNKPSEQTPTIAGQMHGDFMSHCAPERLFVGAELGQKLMLPCESGIHLRPLTEITSLSDAGIAGQTGVYLVLDLGREECGLLELEIGTDQGTILDIAYGEHLDDLRVRSAVGGRNFASRYRCKEGRQTFTHYFTRWAGRYIQLHISGLSERFALYYAGLRPMGYPLLERGRMELPDRLHARIAETAVRTLRLCMHEHYEDSPWREQALYTMDARNQALCGYYSFGEYDFPAASFRLMGEGMRADGYLEICAPAEVPITIPAFSLIWIMEVAEHYLYSGDEQTALTLLPAVDKMLGMRIAEMKQGLLPTPSARQFWNYYDWAEGLDDSEALSPKGANRTAERLDAPLNLFMALALEAAVFMHQWCGDEQRRKEYAETLRILKQEIHRHFWDQEAGMYVTYRGEGQQAHYAELTQSLALLAGVCPPEEASGLHDRLAVPSERLVPITLSHAIFKYKALLEDPDTYGQKVIDEIMSVWGEMLFSGATSFWETVNGADDFAGAGSLCHGWSSVPLYIYYAHVLGVRPVEPGFRVFEAKPVPSGFHKAAGAVPTPHGLVEIAWQATDSGLHIELDYPEAIRPTGNLINRA